MLSKQYSRKAVRSLMLSENHTNKMHREFGTNRIEYIKKYNHKKAKKKNCVFNLCWVSLTTKRHSGWFVNL